MSNPFTTANTYSEMLKKISWYTFFASLISIIIINNCITELFKFTSAMPLTIQVFGTNVPLIIVLPAFAIAVIFALLKMHNIIALLFGIRKRFDVYHILVPMAIDCGLDIGRDQIDILINKRREIIGKVFYQYATSDLVNAAIDRHVISMAINQWSWYWVLVESSTIAFISAIVLVIYKQYFPSFWFIVAIAIMLILMALSRQFSKRYARDQINLILQDSRRKENIQEAFSALLS